MIDNLPFDLKLEFMKHCDMKTFTNLYMTNRDFHGIMKSFIKIDDLSFRKQIPKNIKTMDDFIDILNYCKSLSEHKKPIVCVKCRGAITHGEWIVSLCDCLKNLIQFVKKSDKRYRHVFPHDLVMFHKECSGDLLEAVNFRTRIFRCPLCNGVSCGYLAALTSF